MRPETADTQHRPGADTRAAAWLLACLLASLVAWPRVSAATLAPASASAPASAVRAPSDDVPQQILALDDLGTNDPAASAQQLGALIARLPDNHPSLWLAWMLRAHRQSEATDWPGLEQSAQALAALATRQPDALAAGTLVQALRATQTGPMSRVEALATAARSQLQPAAHPMLQFMVVSTLALAKQARGRLDEAIALRRQELTLSQSLSARQQVTALLHLSYPLILGGQAAAARQLIEQALSLAQAGSNHHGLYEGHTQLGFMAAEAHAEADELTHLQAALHHARLAGSQRLTAQALLNLIDHDLNTAHYASALRKSEDALALLGQGGNQDQALFNRGLAWIGMGQLAEGLRSVHDGMEIVRQRGMLDELVQYALELARFLERTGHPEEAVRAFSQHRRLAVEAAQQQQQQAVQALQEAHEAEQRALELATLQQDNQQKQDQLSHQTQVTRAWAALALCAALVAGFMAVLLGRLRRTHRALSATHAHLQQLALLDALTGLPNRRQLMHELQSAGPRPLLAGAGLLMVDIDHFKAINDRLGHAGGDQVLVEVAKRLQLVMAAHGRVVRWGGEEFLGRVTGLDDAGLARLAQRLLEAIGDEPVAVSDQQVRVTVSIGHARLPQDVPDTLASWDAALQALDQALYRAKAQGRHCACAASAPDWPPQWQPEPLARAS